MLKAGRIFIVFVLTIVLQKANAQTSAFSRYQDSLLTVSSAINAETSDAEKIALNADFVKTLVNALKIPYSFNFPFDSLTNISVLKSPDNMFRLITWYLPLSDGTYRYYGAIQLSSPDGKLKLQPLTDGTERVKDKNAILTSQNWYGARYYDIIPVSVAGRQPYYVLLGWKGKSAKVSSKIIEILSFEKNEAVFGKAVFDGVKGQAPGHRIILEYNKFNSMTLQRDPAVNLIVLDHLAPIDPSKKGDPEFYASDSSFDAYKVVNGRLRLIENIELKNPPSAMDEFYNDPKKSIN